MADDKKTSLGPTGTQVQANIQRLREARGMTKKNLANQAAALGRPIPPLGVSRIEAGTRRVDADDLVALALVLNVSPLALLLPNEDPGGTTPVELLDDVYVPFEEAWQWGAGERALPAEDGDGVGRQRQEDYERLSLPAEEWHLRKHPAGQALATLASDVRQLIRFAGWSIDDDLDDEFARRASVARASVSRLLAEIDRMEVDHADVVESRRKHQEARRQERVRGARDDG